MKKKEKKKTVGFFSHPKSYIPIIFFAMIIFFARGSFMDAINSWGHERPKGVGERLLQKEIFTEDQYHRRDVVDPDEVVELDNGTMSIQHLSGSDMSVTEMEFKLSNGDIYHHTQLPFSEYLRSYNQYKFIISYEFKNGWVTYYDPETEEWVINERIRSGVSFPATLAFINLENEKYLVFDQAYAYKNGKDGNIIASDQDMGKIFVSQR